MRLSKKQGVFPLSTVIVLHEVTTNSSPGEFRLTFQVEFGKMSRYLHEEINVWAELSGPHDPSPRRGHTSDSTRGERLDNPLLFPQRLGASRTSSRPQGHPAALQPGARLIQICNVIKCQHVKGTAENQILSYFKLSFKT